MKHIAIVALLLIPCASFAQQTATAPAAPSPQAAQAAAMNAMANTPWAKTAVEKSPRHREWVKLKNGNRSVDAFVVYPEVKNKATSVVVIHEIFGMTDWVQMEADEVAEAGYIAIAPDL